MTGFSINTVAVIGAGTMGAGIAQVAAAAGHRVFLYDVAEGAASAGHDRIAAGLRKQVERGKLVTERAEEIVGLIQVADALSDFAEASLVIEAIVENLQIKQRLFAELETLLSEDAILATNTSSISVTAIGAGLKRPERLVGMHFFNPAPIMKLVEVVSGLATSPEVARMVHATAESWGKIAVQTKSTPGFIVNRVGRAFYGEPLRLAEEGVATPATIDALMREGGGFRMGPFELMDLIGNDVNFAVSTSVFEAYQYEPRFRPSLMQRELVDAGRFGRKSGQGFYSYAENAQKPDPSFVSAAPHSQAWAETFEFGGEVERDGVLVALTDGRTARQRSSEAGVPVILIDLCDRGSGKSHIGFTTSSDVPEATLQAFLATLERDGLKATHLPDWPGLVVLRTLSLIANEGFEAVLQGVTDEGGVDLAMRFGVNYPHGPMAWARAIGLARILAILDNLFAATGDMRYRASLGLRNAVADA